MTKDLCEVEQVHEQMVQRVQEEMPDLSRMASFMKALADETRLKIAFALTIEKSLCVCDVAHIIETSVATASHHLRYLKEHGLAHSSREGKQIYYSLADHHVHQIVTIAYAHIKEVSECDD